MFYRESVGVSRQQTFFVSLLQIEMDLTKKILAELKPKVGAFGFNRKELMGVAAGIANNLNLADDASEEDIDAAVANAVNAAIPVLQIGQMMATRVINKAKSTTSKKTDEDDDDDGNDEDDDDDDIIVSKKTSKSKSAKANQEPVVPAWVEDLKNELKTLTSQVETMQGEKLSATRRGKLRELLKDTGTFGSRTLKSFDKMTFESDEDFEDFFAEVEEDLKTLNQERADAGLAHLGTPPAVPPAGEQGKKKKELVTDEEIEKMANGF